ncbi:ATP-binding protein [Kribbella turkmenica]|uniref:ATP-binding protein n=1 Tax=Kribbella turkmenica TaxID=2530375 RepID=A0A4R4W7B2_9ACTN|nr:ATP-binding protein [Kribbella turkmenica]TDD14568.1 ATP-binding protein [Kribbella turkmenica]
MREGEPATGTVGALLADRRRRTFAGRRTELGCFRTALAGSTGVLYVHGPGGIGKTSLLRSYADLATSLGATVLTLDGRDLEPVASAVLDSIGAASIDDVPDALPGSGTVLLVDTYEQLGLLDDWFREDFLPRLPDGVLTVLAGRLPPASAWTEDPGWSELLHVLALRNLNREDARVYLRMRGVPDDRQTRVLEVSHGHPLGLSLLTDLVDVGGEAVDDDPLTPDLVATLLRRFVDVLPTGPQRGALEICALARTTTEALLRDGLGVDDAHELFGWLRGLSFVESGPDGIAPHDLARDVLVADLRWRDPEGYDRIFRRLQNHILARLRTTSGRRQQRALYDAKYLHRHQGTGRVWTDWDSFGRHYPETAQPDDRAAVLELIRRWEGAESATIAAHWWERQPAGFQIVRHHDGRVRGVLACIDLTLATPDDLAVDPGALAAVRFARANVRRRPDDLVTQWRFCVDGEAYQDPSPTINLGPVVSIQHWLRTPRLAADFLTFHDPARREEFFAFYEIRRAADADFAVGGRQYGLFVRDLRRLPLDDWLRIMFDRDLAGEPAPLDRPGAEPVLLSEPDFGLAVRAALRDLHRRDALSRNPLTRSALIRGHGGPGDPADLLGAVVRRAVGRLADTERDQKLHRALDRTYLRPAATQERAAELLGLPLSTFKRHLNRGVERVAADLWRQELETEPGMTW